MEPNLDNYLDSTTEDYINMEVDSFACLFSHIYPTTNQEFEFQSFSTSSDDRDNTAAPSPADELFYMGKLLPLHETKIPQKQHQNEEQNQTSSSFSTPLFTPTATANPTPFQSCHVSPSQSRHVSRELSPHEYNFVDYPSFSMQEKLTWTKRLKLINKSSKAYLKSLFSIKSPSCSGSVEPPLKAKECRNENIMGHSHRRSFSGAFKAFSVKAKVSSDHENLKRSCSSSSEIENPIQAAIAHCKRSQSKQQFYSSRVNDEERLSRIYRG